MGIAWILTGFAAPVLAVDPNAVIDLRMDQVNFGGVKKELVLDGAKWVPKFVVEKGKTIGISCTWSANLIGAGYWQTKVELTIQYIIKIDQDTKGTGSSSMPAHTKLGSEHKNGKGYNYGYEFSKKTPGIQWTAEVVGSHSVSCVLPETGLQEPNLDNNIALATLEVVASPKQHGKTLKKPDSTHTPGSGKPGEVDSARPSAPQSAGSQVSERFPVPSTEPIMAPASDQSRRHSRLPDDNRQPNASGEKSADSNKAGQQMVARVPANMFTVEGEQLVQAGKASANGGKVVVQPMAGFGQGWSQNAQLFWSGGAVGAVLDLTVDVPAASAYAVEVYLTRAPDYADLKIEIDGKPSPVTFSGFAPAVMAPNPMQAGKFSLQPGARKVSFMISGKYQQATNYFVGIDRVVFYPAGAP
jgi:hypothetical protein